MKNRSLFIILFFALLLSFSLFINIKQFIRSEADAGRIAALSSSTRNGQAKVIMRYVHDSIEHVVIKEAAAHTLAEKNTAVGAGYLDTLSKAIKIASNRIDQVTQINARLEAENLQLKKSATLNQYTYQDKWLNISYNPDSNLVGLNYNVSLNTARYWKRPWLLGAKEYYLDIFSEDSRVKINSAKRYTYMERKVKKFGLGFSAGYSFIPFLNQWQPTLGVGLNYNLIQF